MASSVRPVHLPIRMNSNLEGRFSNREKLHMSGNVMIFRMGEGQSLVLYYPLSERSELQRFM